MGSNWLTILAAFAALFFFAASVAMFGLHRSAADSLCRIRKWCRSHKFETCFLAPLVVALVIYAGDKPEPPEPPGPVTIGISLISVTEGPNGVHFEWETDDERITPGEDLFFVQRKKKGAYIWETITPEGTYDMSYDWVGFSLDRTYDYRVIAYGFEILENGGLE